MPGQIIAKLSTRDGLESERVIPRIENDIQIAFVDGLQAFTGQETCTPNRQKIIKKLFRLMRVETIGYYKEI